MSSGESSMCIVPQQELPRNNSTVPQDYFEINLTPEFNTSSGRGAHFLSADSSSWRDVMLPVQESVLKRITHTFFESGFMAALNVARDSKSKSSILAAIADYTYRGLDFFYTIHHKILPHAQRKGVEHLAIFVETRDWTRSYVRYIAWHPNYFKIAVAGSDDIVRVYTDEGVLVPVLKCASQKAITCIAWRPNLPFELAVACEKGICYWVMDTAMHITRSVVSETLLKHPNHAPVSSVQWNPDGTLLASSSINDTDILIWDVDKMRCEPLKRIRNTCSILKWSPNGSSLFSATTENVFRIWNAESQWTPEQWRTNAGRVQSACWSPCGNFLFYVTSESTNLFRLQLSDEYAFVDGNASKHALAITDLRKITIGHREVGGFPQSLAWDPNGIYLAITFKDTACVAILCTCIQKFSLNVSPVGFITGMGTEFPSFICFQSKNRSNKNSVLTIGWSSGRVEYYPLKSL